MSTPSVAAEVAVTLDQIIHAKFSKEGFSELTAIQKKALPVISRKINCLLVAPTGSGKTEAAVMPVFSMLSHAKGEMGTIRAIYITPLRALNNDVLRRIVKYAESDGLRVEIRHGDTTAAAKKKIVDNPPDVLITTPESLAVVLTSDKMLAALRGLEYIIVDEVHELVPSERGSHLSISLERLQAASQKHVSRIGLSATVGNLKEAAQFVSGAGRKHAILVDSSARGYDIDVKYVKGSLNNVAHFVVQYVKESKVEGSVLLFTNTRDEAEYLGTILKNQSDIKVDIHHGSLSKEMREETENTLRAGEAGIVVCTSSLELGLDIGSVDLVIHYGSPRQVSKLMQRIGRSRHKQRTFAKGLIVTNNADDEIEALAIINRMKQGSIEEQRMHEGALDAMAHHLVGLAMQTRDPVRVEDAYELVTRAYPFRNVSLFDLESCLDILAAHNVIKYDRESRTYTRKIKAFKYYFENLSMIPHVLKFEVIDTISKRRIGTLDQQFVGDYGERGNVFVLKSSQWRVLSVDEGRMVVNVEPLHGAAINIPYWVGEMIPVDSRTAEQVGSIRSKAAKGAVKLSTDLVQDAAKSLGVIPDSKNVVVESFSARNMLVMHAAFGSKVNNTLASLLSTILSSQLGYIVESRSDAYRIMLTSSARMAKGRIEAALNDVYDLEPVIIASLTGTHQINWKVWMVAKRFGMIAREAVYDKKAARMIYDRYAKTPVSSESIRELVHDKYDIEQARKVLSGIKEGAVKIHWLEVTKFSDLARPIMEHSAKSAAAPQSIEKGVIELVKERLEKTKHRLVCIRCGKWERVMETREAPEEIVCPSCRSKLVTATFWSDYDISKIIQRRLAGGKLLEEENHRFERAWKVASLVNNFGKKALIVLAGHGVGADTAARILRNYIDDDLMYRGIYEAEKQYVITRGFWND
ncbi:ATP dependent helicase, Lhr family [Candidatus Nitrososphaera evergladensis SR1]|uniref:ATP dependent helicase, Lhr family n=1 Tax=Candidatus Nitrososphaera evergladensis SR1 TaxID=1459636 RepID=A0A075MQI4_9ARCH|nr:DEAD/DEAH box helicase [Candidatus Nitrososphaera evergladensis]AIF83132.1 ATP dependent helicase, Lhr family [Candidatus Nitrososphaera evergladensis SR1]